jgi:hypothetical protein
MSDLRAILLASRDGTKPPTFTKQWPMICGVGFNQNDQKFGDAFQVSSIWESGAGDWGVNQITAVTLADAPVVGSGCANSSTSAYSSSVWQVSGVLAFTMTHREYTDTRVANTRNTGAVRIGILA